MKRGINENKIYTKLNEIKKKRNAFFTEMEYDELNYKIKKLQNSQRLEPTKEKLQQIVELKKKLEELEIEMNEKLTRA